MKKRISSARLGSTFKTKSMYLNQVRDLFDRGHVVTTLPKAKNLSRLMDNLISRSQAEGLATLRLLEEKLGSFQLAKVVYSFGQQVREKRQSGFVALRKMGFRRGDAAPLARVELLDFEKKEVKPKKEEPKKEASKKEAPKKVEKTKVKVEKDAKKK